MGGTSSTTLKRSSSRVTLDGAADKAEDAERAVKELERYVLAKIDFHHEKAEELENRFEEFMRVSQMKVDSMERNTKLLEERMVGSLNKVDAQLQEIESKSAKFEDFLKASREEVAAMEKRVKQFEEQSRRKSEELERRMKGTLSEMELGLRRADEGLGQMEKDQQEKYDQITKYLESVAAVGEVFAYAGRALSCLSRVVFHVFYFPWWIMLMGVRLRERRLTEARIAGLVGDMSRGNGRYRYWSFHQGCPCYKNVTADVFLYFIRGEGWHLSPELGSVNSWARTATSQWQELEEECTWICSSSSQEEDLVTIRRPCCSDAAMGPVFWWLGAFNAVGIAWAVHRFVNPLVDMELLTLEVPFVVWALSISILVSAGTFQGFASAARRDELYKKVVAMFGESSDVEMHFDESVMFIFGMLPALMSSFLTYYFTRELAKSVDCNPDYRSEMQHVAYCMSVSASHGFEGHQEVCCRVVQEARFTFSTFIAIFLSNTQVGYIGVKYAIRMAIAAQKRDGKAADLLTRLRTRRGSSIRIHDAACAKDLKGVKDIVVW